MSQLRYLKVVYLGKCHIITYTLGSTYNKILTKIMRHFKIPSNHKSLLVFTNDAGKVFSRRQLTNFLLIFPYLRMRIHLRYDNNSTAKPSKLEPQKAQRDRDDIDCNSTYPTTPVFRMNCFIGVYPSSTSNNTCRV